MEKIQVYAVVTSRYEPLFELFKQSIYNVSDHFEVIPIKQKQLDVRTLMDENFQKCMVGKFRNLQDVINKNMGKVIVVADCDIIVLKNPYPDIDKMMKQNDFIGIPDGGERGALGCPDYINMGWMAIRCSEVTKDIIKKTKNHLFRHIINRKNLKDNVAVDQYYLNRMLEESGISFEALPKKDYYSLHMRMGNPEKIRIEDYHSKTILHFSEFRRNREKTKLMWMKELYNQIF